MSLYQVAVLESAFNEMEEISNEFGFLGLINTFKELGVHLLLEVFVHVNLKITLEKSFFSERHFVHIGIHTHVFDFGHHLLLLGQLVSFGCAQ